MHAVAGHVAIPEGAGFESLHAGAPKGRKRAPLARLAQSEASECEAVGLGTQRKDSFLTAVGPRLASAARE
jgi:hypothetical protein